MTIAWRPLLRELVSYLLVAGLVLGLATVVWWTRHPESPSLSRLRSWPLVGAAAGRLQDYYLAVDRATAAASSGAEPLEAGSREIEIVYEPREPRPYIWVSEGTVLRREPRIESESVGVMEAMTNLFVEERRGDWVRVRRAGADAWILRPRPGSSESHGGRPSPVLPLPARPPDPAVLERAAAAMSGESHEFRLAAYAGRSDFDVSAIVTACEPLLAVLEDDYHEELGVEPVGEAAEVFLLFASRSDYETFSGLRSSAVGHSAPGYAATHAENRRTESVCGTLVHETVHLLNRRAIGPALPPWLGEGLAEYVQWLSADGLPSAIGAWRRTGAEMTELETLVELDEEGFHGGGSVATVYVASGLWIAYLMADPELRPAFRQFLRYLVSGGPWAENAAAGPARAVRRSPDLGDDLLHFLGRDYERLDSGIRAWLWSRS